MFKSIPVGAASSEISSSINRDMSSSIIRAMKERIVGKYVFCPKSISTKSNKATNNHKRRVQKEDKNPIKRSKMCSLSNERHKSGYIAAVSGILT